MKRKWINGVEVDPDAPTPPNPWEVEVLARYNSQRACGLMHTDEWIRKMADLQHRFDESNKPFVPQADNHA